MGAARGVRFGQRRHALTLSYHQGNAARRKDFLLEGDHYAITGIFFSAANTPLESILERVEGKEYAGRMDIVHSATQGMNEDGTQDVMGWLITGRYAGTG